MTWGWVCGSDSDDKTNLSCQLNLHWTCWAGTELGKKWKNFHIIHNVDYFEMSVGGSGFSDFPQIQMTKIWPWFWWYMGDILVRYTLNLVHVWLIFDWNNPNVTVLYEFGTILGRVRRPPTPRTFQRFSNLDQRGVLKIHIFSKFKIFHIIVGGAEKIWTLLLCVTLI